MFYRDLAGIAGDLVRKDHNLDTILQIFCMRRFAERKFLASFFFQTRQDGVLEIQGFYGANPAEIGLAKENLSVFSDHPAAECIRNDSMICTKPKSNGDSSIELIHIAWPVQHESRTIGALVTVTDKECEDSDESKECLESIAILLNNALIRVLTQPTQLQISGRNNGKAHRESEQEYLTERQEVILRLIAEGRTNGDIAEILGYSESLIRQETIRIYALLGCNGRQEAALIYRSRTAVTT